MISRVRNSLGGAFAILLAAMLLSSCNSADSTVAATPTGAAEIANATAPTPTPEWFGMEMTDVKTGETFTIRDFAGKVVLIETMAQWCPTCNHQEDEVKRLRELLGNPEDLVSISLDVDLHEDAASLKKYAEAYGYDWRFAVAPLEVQRALGNLYNAEYLNPPLAPMLVIDRAGRVFGLPFGLKSASALKLTIEPHLAQ